MKHIKKLYFPLLLLFGLGTLGLVSQHEKNNRIRALTDQAMYQSCARDPSVNCPPSPELLDAAYNHFYQDAEDALNANQARGPANE